jgi:hypothetical protein
MTASTGSYGAITDWLGSVTGPVNSSGSHVESTTYKCIQSLSGITYTYAYETTLFRFSF